MKCFYSYSRKDKDFAERLVTDLKACSLDIWWDPGINPGSRWDTSIETALDGADVFLVALSRHSAASDNVLIPREANMP